jgi:hypothetical protein
VNLQDVACIDFETYPITQRPEYPPRPVGMALRAPWHDGPAISPWGHPTANNCTHEDVRAELGRIWDSGVPMLCHHAKFDIEVACHHFKLPMLPWERIHDTHVPGLPVRSAQPQRRPKELAEDLLQWPPEEKDAMAEWIMAHSARLLASYPWNRDWDKKEQRFKEPKKITKSKVGMWIFATPGDIAGPYAMGDIHRTLGLFRHLAPIVEENGMWGAYNRERELMPILLENERDGMRVRRAGAH